MKEVYCHAKIKAQSPATSAEWQPYLDVIDALKETPSSDDKQVQKPIDSAIKKLTDEMTKCIFEQDYNTYIKTDDKFTKKCDKIAKDLVKKIRHKNFSDVVVNYVAKKTSKLTTASAKLASALSVTGLDEKLASRRAQIKGEQKQHTKKADDIAKKIEPIAPKSS